MIRLRARSRLLLALAIILAFSYAAISLLHYRFSRVVVHETIVRRDLSLTINNIYSELSSILTKPLIVSSTMVSDSFLAE